MSQLYAPSVAITIRWEKGKMGCLENLSLQQSTRPPPQSLFLHSQNHHQRLSPALLPLHKLRGNSSFKCLSVLPAKQRTFDDDDDDVVVGKIGAAKKREFSLPNTLEESIDQARFACRQAIKNGKVRLQLELPLPLIGATDLDDWPGGIQQQFKAAVPMVNLMLTGLTQRDPTEENTFQKYIVDEGDAVGVWENDDIALVLFPTADSLSKVEALAKVQGRPLLLFNAQWKTRQVISDFGFGDRRKACEQFVESFRITYYLKQYHLQGQIMRLLKCYPGDWQVFVIDSQGDSNCAAVTMHQPSYNEMEEILKKQMGPKAGNNWFSRLFQ